MKTSELKGAPLDYWVARAEEIKWASIHEKEGRPDWCAIGGDPKRVYAPSTDWAQGGPLIEKWRNHPQMEGLNWNLIFLCNAPLQAICRAVVRAAFGDEVEDLDK